MATNKEFNLLDIATISDKRVKKFDGSRQYVATADIDLNQIIGGEQVTYSDRPSRADLLMGKDDVLFAKMKNTVKVLDGSADVEDKIFSTGFYIFTPNASVSTKYLYFYFLSDGFNQQKNAYCTGATMAAIGNSGLRKIKISIPVDSDGEPDMKEQNRIVALLEEAEDLKKKRAEADKKMRDVIPALFNQMFGDIRSNNKSWPMVRFDEVGKSRLGKMLDTKKQTGKNRKPYIKNTNVKWGYFDLSNLPEMDFTESEQEEFRLRPGDLLVCEGGEIGRSAIWRNEIPECYFQKALHRVRLDQTKAVPEYVAEFLRVTATNDGFRELIGTATIPHLTGVQLASIKTPLPPIELQNEFADKVRQITVFEDKQKRSGEQIGYMFNSILAKI